MTLQAPANDSSSGTVQLSSHRADKSVVCMFCVATDSIRRRYSLMMNRSRFLGEWDISSSNGIIFIGKRGAVTGEPFRHTLCRVGERLEMLRRFV